MEESGHVEGIMPSPYPAVNMTTSCDGRQISIMLKLFLLLLAP